VVVQVGHALGIEAVLWRMRYGVSWRDLPKRFGAWSTVFARFSCWKKNGVWAKVLAVLKDESSLHELLVDSTTVRAHQHAPRERPRARRPSAARAAGSAASCI
jgi:transposase